MDLSLDEQVIYENCRNHISRHIDSGSSFIPQLFVVDSLNVVSTLNAEFSVKLKQLETLDSSILMRFINAKASNIRAFAIVDYDRYLELDASTQINSTIFIDGLFIPSASAKDFVLELEKKKMDKAKQMKRKKVSKK